ncbi:MAG: hypothetical protein JW884_01430 [Deltaproteobacteria bacterium]|nr:hypothetical protein [Deltaproteobacteria bacterium]
MKRTMSIVFIACLVFSLIISIQSASAAERIRIPYLSHGGDWFCGLAVTNLTSTAINVTMDLVTSEGNNHSMYFQYRTELPEIDPYAILAGPITGTEGMYGTGANVPGPDIGGGCRRFWVELWHSGTEDFAALSFMANLNSGAIAGYAYETFFSTANTNTFGEYSPPTFAVDLIPDWGTKYQPFLPKGWSLLFP